MCSHFFYSHYTNQCISIDSAFKLIKSLPANPTLFINDKSVYSREVAPGYMMLRKKTPGAQQKEDMSYMMIPYLNRETCQEKLDRKSNQSDIDPAFQDNIHPIFIL